MKRIAILSILFATVFLVAKAQKWHADFNVAQEIAIKENKNIILVFQGSDWCVPCMKLEKNIWNSEEFKKFSDEDVVLLKADFPRKKKNKLSKEQQEKNNKLAERYNRQGFFPLVVVLDEKGSVLGTLGYKNISPSKYIKLLTSF